MRGAKSTFALALLFAGIAVAVAGGCGTRVSLGELDDETSADGTRPAPVSSSTSLPPIDAAPEGSRAVDGGPAPSDDGGAMDGGKAPYMPCAGKICGAACTACDPLDPSCVETAVLKQCDKTGACVAAPAGC